MIGEPEVAQRFFARSRNWQNLFDPATEFFRARRNGGFVEPFDPYEVSLPLHRSERVAVMVSCRTTCPVTSSSSADAVASLNGWTRSSPHGTARQDATRATSPAPIGQYAHGNEPSQ